MLEYMNLIFRYIHKRQEYMNQKSQKEQVET